VKHLVHSSIWLTGIRVAGVLVQTILILYLAHALPVPEMGIFGAVYTMLGLLRFLGPLGSDQVVLRRAAAEQDSSVSKSLSLVIYSSFALTIGVSAVVMAGCIALLSGSLRLTSLVAVCLAVPPYAVMGAFISQIRGMGRNLSAQAPEALGVHVLFGLCVLAQRLIGDVTLASALWAQCIAGWGVVLVYTLLFRAFVTRRLVIPGRDDILRLAREGWGVFQALGVTALTVRAPVLLAAAFQGATGAAVMTIAVRFGSVATMTTTSVSATFSPHFAELSHRAEYAKLRKSLFLASLLAAIPAILWFGIVSIAAHTTMSSLLPHAYEKAASPMSWIALAYAFNASFGLSTTLMFMSGNASVVAVLSIVGALSLGAVLFLAPGAGLITIALALVVALLLRDGGTMVWVLFHLRRNGNFFPPRAHA
jgi:O-antigen/teichoic acid export membrane protein